MSCPATDETAQKMLSTVEISPASIIKKKRYKNQRGRNAITAPTFTSCVSAMSRPAPAANNPKQASDVGTIPNINAAEIIVRFTLSGLTQNTRCQNIWSPNVPESRPMVVGRPKDNITAMPVVSNKCL